MTDRRTRLVAALAASATPPADPDAVVDAYLHDPLTGADRALLDGFTALGEICGGLAGVRLRWLRDQHRWHGELLRAAWIDYLLED